MTGFNQTNPLSPASSVSLTIPPTVPSAPLSISLTILHTHPPPQILRLAWLFRDGELHDDNVTNALGRIYSAQCAENELFSSSVVTYNHPQMVLNILPLVSFLSHTISLPIIDHDTLFTRQDLSFAPSATGYFLPMVSNLSSFYPTIH